MKKIFFILILLSSIYTSFSQASFTAPDTVCVNTPITINNTSTGATTYKWNFCDVGSNAPVIAGNNLGNIGGNFSVPVFMNYVLDNGNYYGFVVNWQNSSLVRLDFGNSLLNTPTSTIINTQGQLPSLNGAEDIQLIMQNGKWFGFIVGGSPTVSNNPSVIIKLEFGATIVNASPTVTNWGNIGNMEQPHQLYMWQQNNNWYGFVFNAVTNSLTRFNFTNSFNNTPTGTNLGAIGNLFYPSNFDVINDNGTFRIFVTNTKNNTISRLDFGNSLLNIPTGINLGTLGGVLSFPRGIRIENSCNEIYGYICNQTGNDITKIDFANSLLNTPTAISLGNIGNLNNPISFSKTFIVGNDKYFFVPNANTSNTISLLKFSGCTNSSIPNSTTQTPPQISYNTAGTYNINLTIDESLATQSNFCKQIVVKNCTLPCTIKPDFSFSQNICNPKQVTFKNETPNTSTFKWDFGNNTTNTTNQTTTVTYANNTGVWVQLFVTQTNGCKDSAGYFIDVNSNLDTSLITNKDTSICSGASFKIKVKDVGLEYCWSASSGSVLSNAISQDASPTTNTVYYFYSKVAEGNLVINGDFEAGNTGFTSEHIYKTPPRTSQSQYYIGTNPNVWFNPFVACKDHTSNGGNMMMFDGSATANTAMWKQTVAVQPRTDYLFSGWVQSIVAQDPAQIILKINGNKVGVTTKADLNACSWKQFSAIWNSGNNTTANLSILDSNIVVQGNDFAIDDISFAPIIIKTDSVKVDVINCNTNTACKGVVELHGSDKVSLPSPQNKYYAASGFTWETWFNSSYYANNNNSNDTRNKLMSAIDIIPAEDILIGFGWTVGAKKNELCFVVDGAGGIANRDNTPCVYKPAAGFAPNTWYHVAGVRDYTNNQTKLYVNGQLVDTKTNVRPPITRNMTTFFGNFFPGLDSGFAGKMDEIRVWNTVRTANEIQTNYDKCLAGNETGLVAYYRSNEKTGTTLKDATSNGNNGTLTSTVTFNKSDNAPLINSCLLATLSTNTATICTGQAYWGHNATGIWNDTFVNSVGCDSIRILNLTVNVCNNAIASFTTPDTVCVNALVNINNTSTGATTYNWNYCSQNVNSNVGGINTGNIGNNFQVPVFMDYVQDNGNYYGFVVNHNIGGIVRLDFGNNLLNTPTAINLGNIGGVMNVNSGSEGIRIMKQNGKYFIYVVGGSVSNGSLPKLLRFEFGTNITNTTPIATDFGNIGNMDQSINFYTFQENNNWYGFTINAFNNTITRINFTNDLTNTPTAVNLGNIGNLFNYPCGIAVLNDNGFWRAFITNGFGNSNIIRLDFGSSMLNTPVAVDLGNPNGALNLGISIIINKKCDDIVGYVVNGSDNTIARITFNSLTSVPTGVNLGNIGGLSKPHSLSKIFSAGSNDYTFITNANSNSITRLQFTGCNNSSIPNSTTAIPPSISYNSVGTYNINLTVDEGLPTQSSFCKKVVVVTTKKDSINYTNCQGQTNLGYSIAGIYSDTFKTSNCDSIRKLNLKVLPATVTTFDTIPASCGSVSYNGNVYLNNTLVTITIKNYLGCDSIIQQHQIIVNQNKRDTTMVSICNGQSYLGYNVSGVYKVDSVRLSNGCDSISMVKLSVDKYIKDSVNISICYGDKYGTYQYAGIYYDTIKSTTFCDTIRAINLSVKPKLNPKLLDDASICEKDSIVLSPGNFYSYLWNTNATSTTLTAKSVGIYWVQVADTFGCNARDTFNLISINPIPKDFLPNSLSVCDGEQYTLTGYYSYNWMTGETTPTISVTTLPLYSVKVTDINGCSGSDSMKVNYVGSLNIQSTNAFSPNGDGTNETFNPFSGSCIANYSMKIFDRWGQLLFETTNPNTGWNGKYKGSILPTAVYYYIINYKNLLGFNNKKSGSITLLR